MGRNYSLSLHIIEKSPVANIPLGLRQYVKDVYSNWWRKWEIYILPTLFPNKTWKTPHPNIKARDICLLHKNLPKKNVASTYKYCRVVQAMPDQDGLVRKAVIRYFNVPSMRAKLREVDIHRLSLLPMLDNVQWKLSQ